MTIPKKKPTADSKITTQEKISLLEALFKGRDDCYGADDGQCVKQPLDSSVLRRHIDGKRRIGVYPLSPGILDGSGTWWIALDIDDHDLNLAIQATESLFHLGVTLKKRIDGVVLEAYAKGDLDREL